MQWHDASVELVGILRTPIFLQRLELLWVSFKLRKSELLALIAGLDSLDQVHVFMEHSDDWNLFTRRCL